MKRKDVVIAIICGLAVAWIAIDFFGKYGWVFLIIFPVLSIIGLWLTDLIGKKILAVHQVGKFFLVGSLASVVDIKFFQLLFWMLPFSLISKAISFLVATFVKYWWNKHWAFEKHEKDGMGKEVARFFLVTLVGLALDVSAFYFFSKIQTGISTKIWVELSIIFAALIAATWSFLGYKFLVFKK